MNNLQNCLQHADTNHWTARLFNSRMTYAIIGGFALLYYCLSARYGIDLDDEGFLVGGAADVLDGKFPLADFNSYQPLMYFLLAGAFRLFGSLMLVERSFLIVHLLIGAGCLYWISRRLLPAQMAPWPPLLYIVAPGPWYKVFFLFHLLVVLATLLYYEAAPNIRRAAVAGLAAGLALISRVEAGLIAIALFGLTTSLIILSQMRSTASLKRAFTPLLIPGGAYFVGLLVPSAVIAAMYAWYGKFDALLGALNSVVKYVAAVPNQNVVGLSGRADTFSVATLISHPSWEQYFYGASLVACAMLLLINSKRFLFSEITTAVDARPLILLSAAALASMSYTYYFVWNSRILSSFAIVYLAEFALLAELTIRTDGLKRRVLLVGAPALIACAILMFCRTNFYSGSITMRVLAPAQSDHPFLKHMIIDETQVKSIGLLRQITSADPNAFLIPMSESTMMGYLSGLQNPTYYRLFTTELFGKERELQAIEQFDRLKVKYFVARSGQFYTNGAPASNLDAFAPLVKSYLISHYSFRQLGDNYVLLTRREDERS